MTGHFLICGLGSLGQYCVVQLKKFRVPVYGIDMVHPPRWEVSHLPTLLEKMVLGDCCQPDILEQANVQACRAVLLVTSDEQINIKAAFAVRLLNPHARLVIRSGKQNLNQLLESELGNSICFATIQLSAPAFAIAALGSDICGFITLNDTRLKVLRCVINPTHRWFNTRQLHELNSHLRRIIYHTPRGSSASTQFYHWEPEARIEAGDVVVYVEISQGREDLIPSPQMSPGNAQANLRPFWRNRGYRHWQKPIEFWQSTADQQGNRLAVSVGMAMLTLLFGGTLLLKVTHPQAPWFAAFYSSAVMLLGGYNDVFAGLNSQNDTPAWMRLLNVIYMLTGTASIAILSRFPR